MKCEFSLHAVRIAAEIAELQAQQVNINVYSLACDIESRLTHMQCDCELRIPLIKNDTIIISMVQAADCSVFGGNMTGNSPAAPWYQHDLASEGATLVIPDASESLWDELPGFSSDGVLIVNSTEYLVFADQPLVPIDFRALHGLRSVPGRREHHFCTSSARVTFARILYEYHHNLWWAQPKNNPLSSTLHDIWG
jgi:hypothetical protein